MAGKDKREVVHSAPTKTVVNRVIELALGAGGGAVTLLSGLLAAVLILYSGYVLYDTFATERAASSNAWDLVQFKPEIMDDYEIPLSSSDLKDINKDYRCWLTVYGTSIDYPVVQGTNDTYYASVDIYRRPSLTGAIYLAAANNADFSDSYNVIYGHHMDSGAMFGSLDNMNGTETGVIITKDEIYDVQFFAVLNTDAYENQIYRVGNRMDSVLDFLRSGGVGGIGIGTEVVYFNEEVAADAKKIVALSTCANANTSGRLVIIGKMTKRIVMKDITVTKIWDDNENQDGVRPESITVVANDGTEAVLSAAENWTAVVSVRKFDNLGEVHYTWTEEASPGYVQISNVSDGDNTVITNQHIPAVKSVTVKKVWDDGNNRDGIRPASVTVALSNGQTESLNDGNSWTVTIDNLPVYEKGTEIDYSWTEEAVAGYEAALNVDGDTTTLVNAHAPETQNLTVTKIWQDNNNQDGIRPEEITVSLYGNGSYIDSLALNESNGWSGVIADQYVFENGKAIAYTWEENTVIGYTLTVEANEAATTLINTHIPETKSLTVTKIWDDNNDQDGKRPRSLRVNLSNGRSVTLNNKNNWTATIDELPVYNAGAEIEYSWTENEVKGYQAVSTFVNGNTTVLTNRHETDTTVATVTKVWEDDNNRDGIRPESITATLSNGQTVVLNDENNWTATIAGLPANANGAPIAYTWSEEDVDGYVPAEETIGTATMFTNKHEIATTSQYVQKIWDDNNNQDGIRPSEITVTLNANTVAVQSVVLNADNGWKAEINDLPLNENGKRIAYTWTEQTVAGYTLTTETKDTITTLINTHVPEVKTLEVIKVWDDANDQDGIRPESLIMTLSNGQSVELNAASGWTGKIEDLPVYHNGIAINYEWTEEASEGYAQTDVIVNGNSTAIVNTHVPATFALSVQKVWEDDDDRDQLRPSTLSVRLLAEGKEITTVFLNSVNEWHATVENLPVNDNGMVIEYSWEEDAVNGYELSSESNGTTTVLTNRHIPATKELTVVKVWDDDDNRDGMRPNTLIMSLYADDILHSTYELNESNEWTEKIEMPVYDQGRVINYTWKEPKIAGYSENVSEEGDVTVFTNIHAPAVTVRTIQKIWDDANNQDGIRPEKLEVYLRANHEVLETIVLSEENEWTYSVDDLPVYSKGMPVSYSWSEEKIPGYPSMTSDVSGTLTTFTNIHTPETTSLTVTKVWDDNNNQDGIRPENLTVTLLANNESVSSVILNDANGWSETVSELPVNANGEPIEYVWDEGEPEGYSLSTVTVGTKTILTNMHETETTVRTIVVIWDDDSNRDGLRPATLTLVLSDGTEVVLDEANNWTATVEALQKYDNGEEIDYSWAAVDVENYELVNTSVDGTVTTFTYHHEIITAARTVIKIWDDDNDRDGMRPENLTVTLNGNQDVILNEENGWTATLENLPVYANGGREIIYKWTENSVSGYSLSAKTNGNTTTLTNTHIPATTELTVIKTWDDDDNREGLRPDSLTVGLYANGTLVQKIVLMNDNRWEASINDLPVNEAGIPIVYTWTEAEVAGYMQSGMVTDGNVTEIINTREDNNYTLTITYRYASGLVAAPTYSGVYRAGDEYMVQSPVISGYYASASQVYGTLPNRNIRYIVIYDAENLGTPLASNAMSKSSGDCME